MAIELVIIVVMLFHILLSGPLLGKKILNNNVVLKLLIFCLPTYLK